MYDAARKSLHFVGYGGMSMIAVSGLDMAAWDALAKAAGMPLCVLLGGSVGPVKSYNSNGLWLRKPEEVAAEAIELRDEGGFTGLKLRLGRERIRDDLTTIKAVRDAVGEDMHLMVDFNQGLSLGEALQRCHMIDDLDLAWIEEPIVYDNIDGYAQLAAELKTRSRSAKIFMVLATSTRRCKARRATMSCRTSCASAALPAGCGRRPLPAQQACDIHPSLSGSGR